MSLRFNRLEMIYSKLEEELFAEFLNIKDLKNKIFLLREDPSIIKYLISMLNNDKSKTNAIHAICLILLESSNNELSLEEEDFIDVLIKDYNIDIIRKEILDNLLEENGKH